MNCESWYILDESNYILIVAFSRFSALQTKNGCKVDMGDTIYLKDVIYQFLGFLPHIGSNMNHGHYSYCYIENDGKWSTADDN
jgi:hypothetical protein